MAIKHIIYFSVLFALACSCQGKVNGNPDKPVAANGDEEVIDLELSSTGWSEVVNEFPYSRSVTLTTSYSNHEDVISVIQPGSVAKLYAPDYSIDECISATIHFYGGSQDIVCTRGADNEWSRYFFEHFEERHEFIEDREYVVRTFHIDESLNSLWALGTYVPPTDWPDAQLDKPEVYFSSEGGEETVSLLNYKGWWICYGWDKAQNIEGEIQYDNFVRASYSDNSATFTDYLDGGWYTAVVPEDGNNNQLVITVTPNASGEPRQATIVMQIIDVFPQIKIFQQ